MSLIKVRIWSLSILLASLGLTLQSCGEDKKIPDVSGIPCELKVVRFEKEMYEVDSSQILAKAQKLAQEHPDFVEIYTSAHVMRTREWADSTQVAVLAHLMRGPQLKMLHDTCMVLYDDFSPYKERLEEAFRFFLYYFPSKPLPEIYTCITEFGYQGFTYGPELLAIGTEHYMGGNFPAYRSIFPQYQYQLFTPERLVAASMGLYVAELLGEQPQNNLLDEMLREGKKLYLLDHLLPYSPDSIQLGYSAAQTQWCESNELEMWNFFRSEDLLYSNDKRQYSKYIFPGPTSPGMPPESPGRTANYMGWQIVKKYMERYPDTTLEELINMKDSQALLKKARYKP